MAGLWRVLSDVHAEVGTDASHKRHLVVTAQLDAEQLNRAGLRAAEEAPALLCRVGDNKGKAYSGAWARFTLKRAKGSVSGFAAVEIPTTVTTPALTVVVSIADGVGVIEAHEWLAQTVAVFLPTATAA